MTDMRPSEAMRRACQAFRAAYDGGAPPLTLPQVAILGILADGRVINQTEVTVATGIDRSTSQDTISRLKARGYVERFRDTTDTRATRVWITKAGKKALRKAGQIVSHAESALMRPVAAADRAAFLRGLRAIAGEAQS